MSEETLVSFVLATRNRSKVLVHALEQIQRCGLDRRDYEILVVDNGSTDGTAGAIRSDVDCVVELSYNGGSCAKDFAAELAAGRYIVFLDDDSFPRPGAVPRMIQVFEQNKRLGAAGYTIHLADGRKEGAALPDVFVGCGVGLRAAALHAVGGLDRSFFMQAEEYDLSFRLAGAGWDVGVFDELHVEHRKTTHSRRGDRTAYYDIRNNLRVAARYLPQRWHRAYRQDWLQRYRWLAERDGHTGACRRGLIAGRCWAAVDRQTHRRMRLPVHSLERFFCWGQIRRRMQEIAESGVRRIVLAGLGKNCLPFCAAATKCDITVAAIGDDCFHAPGRRYRGIPVLRLNDALALPVDAVVVAQTGSVQAEATLATVVRHTSLPASSWFSRESHKNILEQESVTSGRPHRDGQLGPSPLCRQTDPETEQVVGALR